jgi:plasmid stabilization system protein ParE
VSQFGKIAILGEAEGDLDDAFIWYELHKSGLGIAFILEVEKAFVHISQYPYASEQQYKNTFRFVMKRFPYSIYYRVVDSSSEIQVIGVLHHKRNLETLKSRL